MFTEILRKRYLEDIVQLSLLAFLLSALRQRQANRPNARKKGYEEREAQVQATSRLRIGGMISSKPVARGFGCGSGMVSVADLCLPQCD